MSVLEEGKLATEMPASFHLYKQATGYLAQHLYSDR